MAAAAATTTTTTTTTIYTIQKCRLENWFEGLACQEACDATVIVVAVIIAILVPLAHSRRGYENETSASEFHAIRDPIIVSTNNPIVVVVVVVVVIIIIIIII